MKHSLKRKRLIASMITSLFMSSAIISFGFGTYSAIQQQKSEQAIDVNTSKQLAIYNSVKQTSLFKEEYSNRFNNCSIKYENSYIDFDEYSKCIEYLNSNQFVEEIINTYGNDKLKNDLHLIQLQYNDISHINYTCEGAKNLSIAVCGISTGVIASTIAYDMCKMRKRNKSKENVI